MCLGRGTQLLNVWFNLGKVLNLFSQKVLLCMFVKAENPLLHKYVVAKGISLDST